MRTKNSARPQGTSVDRNGGYERRDANVRGLFATVLFLALAGVVIHFVLAGVLGHWNKKPAPTDAWNPPGAPASLASSTKTNWPRLQVAPIAEMQIFRAREETELNTYGWLNRTSGAVHIPIENAIDLLVARGMPDWSTNRSDSGPSILQLQQQRPNQSERSR